MRYRKISLNSPSLWEGQNARVCFDGRIFGPSQLDIPPIRFGTTDPAHLTLTEPEHTAWYQRNLHVPEVHRFLMRDAVVHPPYGIVTIDGAVLEETLAHIPFHLPGYDQDNDEVSLPWEGMGASFKSALHVMGGNYMNHYHWLLDIIPKLQAQPLSSFAFNGDILLPPATSPAQQDLWAHLLRANLAVGSLPDGRAVEVESLYFVPNLVGHGFAPHPGLVPFFDRLRQFLGVDEAASRRIYVARKDSENRALTNEDEVVAVVARYGFESVHLSGLTLVEQARLFASASHIIAPHGAGLANLMFCNHGVSLCELHMKGYLHWCFRRLGGLRGINYGCVVGSAETTVPHWIHQQKWSAPLLQIEAVLNDPQFLQPRDRRGSINDIVPYGHLSAALQWRGNPHPIAGEVSPTPPGDRSI